MSVSCTCDRCSLYSFSFRPSRGPIAACVYAFSARRWSSTSSFFRVSSRSQKYGSSCTIGGSIAPSPRNWPSTTPNATVAAHLRARGGADPAAVAPAPAPAPAPAVVPAAAAPAPDDTGASAFDASPPQQADAATARAPVRATWRRIAALLTSAIVPNASALADRALDSMATECAPQGTPASYTCARFHA